MNYGTALTVPTYAIALHMHPAIFMPKGGKQMDNVMQLVNALNAVAQAIDRLSQKDAEKVIEAFEPVCDAEPAISDPVKEVSLAEVRTVLAEKSRSGFKDQVKQLLVKHGSDKLSGIDSSEYVALLEEATGLGS